MTSKATMFFLQTPMAEDVALPDIVNEEGPLVNRPQPVLPPAISQMIQDRIREINQQRFVPRFPKTSRRTQTNFDWMQSSNGVYRGSGIQVSNTDVREDLDEESGGSGNKRSIGIQTPFAIRCTEEKKKDIPCIDWEQLDEDDHMAQVEERQKAIASRKRDNRRRLQALRGEGSLGDPIFLVSSDSEDEEAEEEQQKDQEEVDSVQIEAENFVARLQIGKLDSSKLIEDFIAHVISEEASDTNGFLNVIIDQIKLRKLPPGVQDVCEMSSMKMVRSLKIGNEKFPHQTIKVAALFIYQQMCPEDHAAEKELFRCLISWICSRNMDIGNHIQRLSRAIQLVKLASEDPLAADFPEDIQQVLVAMKAEYTTLSQMKKSRTSASSGIKLQERLKDATSDDEVRNILLEFSKVLAPFALKAQLAKWVLQKKNFEQLEEVIDVE
ncbi:hypothetical protein B9Z55_026090 [Caenorhabditis nigoni]|uniref:Uncharacterized protein n=2 Tax=Caenorhabditis nigoni TaxID=1611254 RepID=A0A2G5T1I4_9PELO|nr:hypothetical protein B9Z55_026090 [Caenorhabditis nigoni]